MQFQTAKYKISQVLKENFSMSPYFCGDFIAVPFALFCFNKRLLKVKHGFLKQTQIVLTYI